MAVSSVASGNQTCVVTTEHQLGSAQTSAGVYVLNVDLSNLADGDVVVLKIKNKVTSSGSSVLAYEQAYANAQTEKSVFSFGVPIVEELICTITQTDGTARSFIWNLLKM